MGSRRPIVIFLPALAAVCWGGAVVFGILPLAGIFRTGLSQTPTNWDWIWFTHVFQFTYVQAFLSATGSAVVGCFGAWLYSEARFPGRQCFWRLSLLGFSLPPILVVLGFNSFWGLSAIVGVPGHVWLGWPAILVAHIFYNFPLFLRLVGAAMVGRNREPEMVALSLGASRWKTFLSVTVPQLRPAFLSAFFLSFLYCAASFLIVLFLGGGPRFTTLEVSIYQTIKIDFDLAAASRLALVQMGIALGIYLLFLRKGVVFGTSRASGPRLFPPAGRWAKGIIAFYLLGITVLVSGPFLSLLVASLPGWAQLDVSGLAGSLGRSVLLAVFVGGQVVALAIALAYCVHHGRGVFFRGLGIVAIGPLAVSTLILSLAWVVMAPEWMGGFRGNLWLASLIQTVIVLPLAYRPVLDSLGQVPPILVQSSRLLGAGPLKTLWRVEIPLCLPAIRLAFVLGAGFSLGEVGAVILFLEEGMETLPLWIFRLMGRYQFAEAYAVGVLLVVLMAFLFGWLGGERDE